MGVRSIIAAGILTLPLTLAAGAPGTEAGEHLVEAFLSDVRTLSGQFEQRLIDEYGDIVEFSSGTLDIRRPGQFRWAYFEPYEQWLVADGNDIWSYDVDLAQVTVKPQADALANTPALLLGGSDTAMDEFEYDGSFEADGLTWVRMRPREPGSDFKRVDLAFEKGVIARMAFLDNLEQTTLVSLFDVAINDDIEPSVFSFVVPEGVDVVGTPGATKSQLR